MKILKKFFKYFGIILLLIFLFRGWIFRNTFNYTKIGERNNIEITNKKLITEIQKTRQNTDLSILEIIEFSRKLTNKKLHFSTSRTSRNPNEIYNDGNANCIGYAAFFNSIVNYLIKDQDQKNKYRTQHLVGRIDFVGIDLHQFLDHPFFRDHDFNEIEIIATGKKIFIDPSVSDYFGIDRISVKE